MTQVGVENKFKVDLSLTTGDDTFFDIKDSTLEALTIHEKADNTPPTFSILFSTGMDEVPALLHEGSAIVIGETLQAGSIPGGSDVTNKSAFMISSPKIQKQSQNLYRIEASGILNVPEYLHAAKIKVWGLAGGIKIARNILSNYFDIDSLSLTDSEDQMNYIQPNISDMDFVRNISRHSWVREGQGWNDIALTTEGSDGRKTKARIYDMDQVIAKAKASSPLWKFTQAEESFQQLRRANRSASVSGGVPIVYNGDPAFGNKSPLMNVLAGYSRKDLAYNMESQGVETQKALLAQKRLTDNPNFIRNMKLSGENGPSARFSLTGDNVHQQFNIAAYTNLANRALFSSFQAIISFDDELYPIHPLDTAYLQVQSAQDVTQINPYLSGLYIVSEVTREYSNRKISNTIMLVRDGPQSAQGSLG